MELGLNIFLGCCMFIIGSLFGSFFSLATYRLPRKEDIVSTRSYCPNCKHRLEFFDLIPVLSYLLRGAKCKYCGNKISLRYFLLEFSNGILFIILFLLIGYNLKLALVILIYAIIFVLVGASIMKSKMNEDEIKIVNNKNIYRNLNKKSGVFISELVIAFVLFLLTFLIIITINSNTRNKVSEVITRSNANDILLKNIEVCLATKYDNLNSYSHTEEIDGVRFEVTTKIDDINNKDTNKLNIVKSIDVKVSYNIDGEYKELNMKTLKGKM